MKNFIQCGFEFTASIKAKGFKSKSLEVSSDGFTAYRKTHEFYDSYAGYYRTTRVQALSKFPWINAEYSSDDCGCEVATPIIKSKVDAIKHFNEFKTFTKDNGLTLDPFLAKCGLGGCHIHLGLKTIPVSQRKLFLNNIAVFLTNNPQLNWAFNDPNDNVNANCLLVNTNGILGVTETTNKVTPKRHMALMGKYENDTSVLRAILEHPFEIELHKKFAFRYNEGYKTVEIRIFDMPRTLEQHILHSDVAQAIFYYCLKKTQKGILGKLEYKDQLGYQVSFDEAKRKFIKAMKDLGIDISRTRHQMKILKLRYEWNKMSKKEDYLR